jgi:hypothetical protein
VDRPARGSTPPDRASRSRASQACASRLVTKVRSLTYARPISAQRTAGPKTASKWSSRSLSEPLDDVGALVAGNVSRQPRDPGPAPADRHRLRVDRFTFSRAATSAVVNSSGRRSLCSTGWTSRTGSQPTTRRTFSRCRDLRDHDRAASRTRGRQNEPKKACLPQELSSVTPAPNGLGNSGFIVTGSAGRRCRRRTSLCGTITRRLQRQPGKERYPWRSQSGSFSGVITTRAGAAVVIA